ncbi:hypothetical protein SAMN02910275_02752 [Butyrivibrio sp. INlla18]|uniref:DUF6033 family protein n=1 Tax=Butyrivibrio sp. INlla18 TaxID=1520806 RepID=UPI00088949D6|nr:DUF6033 family protein [Butyrivibrio sp. INlla18]SDA76861.1 hypothetical protein SAMN02910275_02752 [Butyrivibrio sp. INlla18]
MAISDVFNNNSSIYDAAKSAGVKDTTTTKTGNYGKTIGKAQLSEEGAKYYEELKKKYSNMDFVLVSKDMKEYAKQNASSFGNANRMVVLIDEEKIERMATDETYRAKYEGLIAKAQSQMPELKSIMQTKGNVKTIGMQVNDNGTASFFAVMQKSSQDMTEKLAAKRAAGKKAEKEAEKKAEKKEAREAQLEKIREKGSEDEEDYEILMADSVEELLKKIDDFNFNLRADTVMTPMEKNVGQNIDFKG